MEKDQRDLLRVFNERKVKYLVVGGYAVSHFTEPRVTKDLDIFIDTSDENVALVYAALATFGAPLAGMTPKDFQDPAYGFQIRQPPSRIDILQAADRIENKIALGGHGDL